MNMNMIHGLFLEIKFGSLFYDRVSRVICYASILLVSFGIETS